MLPPKHFMISVALSIIVIAAGTIGYQSIEGWNFLDSIYMTIITIATVGYAEVHELGDAGKVFTIVIQPGDTVIAVGEVDNLDQLEKELNP